MEKLSEREMWQVLVAEECSLAERGTIKSQTCHDRLTAPSEATLKEYVTGLGQTGAVTCDR